MLTGGYRWKLVRSDEEFEKLFPTEEACRKQLFDMRWGKRYICPVCETKENWKSTRGRLVCRECQRQTTVTAGTIFEGTRKPLKLWFKAAWLLTSKESVSSVISLQQKLGLKNYSTAWEWFHKLRKAMMQPRYGRLGIAEVGTVYLEDKEGVIGQQSKRQILIAIAAVNIDEKRGIFHIKRLPDTKRETLCRFINEMVQPGKRVYTNTLTADDLPEYVHRNPEQRQEELGIPLPSYVHETGELLKRWLSETHPGTVNRTHLDYYLGEFAFRFGHYKVPSHGRLFYNLLWRAVRPEPQPDNETLGGQIDEE